MDTHGWLSAHALSKLGNSTSLLRRLRLRGPTTKSSNLHEFDKASATRCKYSYTTGVDGGYEKYLY